MHITRHLRTALVLAALVGGSACTSETSEVSGTADAVELTDGSAPPPPTTVARSPSTTTTAASTTTPESTDVPALDRPSTTTPPPATSTTTSPTTSPTTTMPPVEVVSVDAAAIDAVDVADQSVFGIAIFDGVDVDAAVDDISARLGAPTLDRDWQSMQGQIDCTGSTQFRVVWWGDFRMTFERYEGNGAVRDELSAWTVGDPTQFGLVPLGEVPTTPAPSNIVTLEGIGLGSTRADLEGAYANVQGSVVIERGGTLAVSFDDDDRIVGFGNGPFDCPVDEQR